MSSQPPVNLVALAAQRQRTLECVNAAFANDLIDIDELERRTDRAVQANDLATLQHLVADLDGVEQLQAPVPTTGAGEALVPVGETGLTASHGRDERRVLSILNDTRRKGSWSVPRKLAVVSVLGNAHIDLRKARIPPGTSSIRVKSILGNIEILVPPGLGVRCEGKSILGNFEHYETPAIEGAPQVLIHGVAILGNVEIRECLPDEPAKRLPPSRERSE